MSNNDQIVEGQDGLKKSDGTKLRYTLLPFDTLEEIDRAAATDMEHYFLSRFLRKGDREDLIMAAKASLDYNDWYKNLEDVVKVLEFGAKKYGDDNWRKGVSQEGIERYKNALLRHYYATEDADPDTGLPHHAHKNCNYLFLCTLLKK